MNQSQLTVDAAEQLNGVNIRPYSTFLSDLLVLADGNGISRLWITSSASQAIVSRIPAEKRLIASKI